MITPEQREMRRQTLGSSDAPAVVGVDPWRSAADVYYSKTTELEDRPSQAMQIGNRMEPVLLDWAEEKLGISLQRIVMQVAEQFPLAANLDGLCVDAVVEAKYVGPNAADYWGEPDTDQVPDHVLVQVMHQMIVTRRELAWVPAAICRYQGLSFEMVRVEFDADIAGNILEIETAWWERHVMSRVCPTDEPAHLDTLKKIRRLPDSILLDAAAGAIAAMLWAQRQEKSEAVKAAEDEHDDVTARILALLGEHDAAQLPDGRLICYREENAGKRLDFNRLRMEHPALFEELSEPTTRRVLRLKKGSKQQ